MAKTSRRWRQFTLAGLMAVVAISALLFAWLRPTDESFATRAAQAFLERKFPGQQYRVTGIAKWKPQVGYDWAVSFTNATGKGSPTYGVIEVNSDGACTQSVLMID